MDKLSETYKEWSRQNDRLSEDEKIAYWKGMMMGHRVAMQEIKETVVQLTNRRR